MPWKEKTVEMNREEFVRRALAKEKSKSALCREYGISRPTGDKWIKRYKAGEGVKSRSRAPFHTANRINEEMEELIVATRKKEPGIGAAKIHRILSNAGHEGLPSISTVNAVFKRNNLITKEASLAATPNKRFEKEAPNIMWQVDFKGSFLMRNGQRCHALSLIDDHSRYCLCADAKENEQLEGVVDSFKKVFREYGLPQILLCDNGNPWGASQSGAYTKFEVWLMDLGILTIHIRPRHPQTQGKNERFNGSYNQERLVFHVPYDLADADVQRTEFKGFFNFVRPHHALGMDVPAQHYKPSERKYTEELQEWKYGSEYKLRRIKSSGYLTYEGHGYFLSEAFAGRTIAVKLSSTEGFSNLYYRQFRIGRINLNEQTVVSRKCYLIEGDPRGQGCEFSE